MQYLVISDNEYYGPYDLKDGEKFVADRVDLGFDAELHTLKPGKDIDKIFSDIKKDYDKRVKHIEEKYAPKKTIISWMLWIVTFIGAMLLMIYLSATYYADIAYTRGYLDKENGKEYYNSYNHRYEADEYRRGYNAAAKFK